VVVSLAYASGFHGPAAREIELRAGLHVSLAYASGFQGGRQWPNLPLEIVPRDIVY